MLRYVFMGSPPFAADNLAQLVEEVGPPVLVVTQAPKARGRGQKVSSTAVGEWARKKGLPSIETENVNEASHLDQIRSLAPQLILVAAFGQILRNEVLSLPEKFCLNVHGSLLPEYRGAAPIQRSIWDGKVETGITIQKMVRKLDAGDILLQKRIDIDPNETSGELFDRLAKLGGECLVEAVKRVEKDDFSLTPQDPAKVTYAQKIDRTDSPINWSESSQRIHNQIRALNPWPVAETLLGNSRIKIYRSSLTSESHKAAPGSIVTDGKSQLGVVCGDGKLIELRELQGENKKRMNPTEFLGSFRGNFTHKLFTSQEHV